MKLLRKLSNAVPFLQGKGAQGKAARGGAPSAISPERVRTAIQNRFNPIRDFTPEKLSSQLDAFHCGNLQAAARTWDAMERRDVYLRNVISKRKKSVARLSWEILTEDDSAEAKAQAEALEEFYNNISVTSVLKQDERGGLSLLIRQMMDAVGKEFAVHEIVWQPGPGGLKAEFRFCPLWWFENRTGRLRFLPHDFAIDGEEMAEGEWLVTVGEGLMECSSVAYVFKHMPLKDWVNFSEKFGMPGVLGKTNAAKDSEEWEAMADAVGDFMNDFAAVCSANDAIEFVEVKSAGNLPFPLLVDYCDRAIASVWRGADLATISQGQAGVGASLQGDETNLLLEDDARLISETLNERVDRYALSLIFGSSPERPLEPKAYIRLKGRASEAELAFKRQVFTQFQADGTVGDIMANLSDLKALTKEVGVPVNNDYVDPYVPVPGVTGELLRDSENDIIGDVGISTEGNEGNKEESFGGLENERQQGKSEIRNPKSDFARATREAFRPVAERLQRVFALENETQMRVELNQVLADWPALKKSVEDGSAKQASVLQGMMEAALVRGFRSRRVTTNGH